MAFETGCEVLAVKWLFYAGAFPPIGGIEAFIRDLSKALTLHGRGVEVLCWEVLCRDPESDRSMRSRDAITV